MPAPQSPPEARACPPPSPGVQGLDLLEQEEIAAIEQWPV